MSDKDQAISLLSSRIPIEMKARGIRGLSIVVADASGTIWSSGFGWADGSGKRAFDSATISNIGSTSKLITSTAIMRLVEQGKIELDAAASRYLPELKPRDGGFDLETVTVRSLLCHHSGLQSDDWMGFTTGERPPAGYPRPFADNALLASQTTLCAAPGSVFSYSNLGYSLLGLIVERQSGTDFHTYVREAILSPLGMDSSSFIIEDRFRQRYASGKSGLRKHIGIPYIRDVPAGSLNSSADDMGRFLSAVIASASGARDRPVSSRSQLEMWTRQNAGAALDLDFSIGLGWWLDDLPYLPGERVAFHGGDLDPFSSWLIVDRTRSLGVFVMANSGGLGSFGLGKGIAAPALRAFAETRDGPAIAALPPPPAPAPAPPSLATRVAGNYATPVGNICISPKGSAFTVYAFGRRLEGFYREDGSIGLRVKLLGIELPIAILGEFRIMPELMGDETVISLRVGGMFWGIGRKIEAATPRPAWLARTGTWVRTEAEPSPTLKGCSLSLDRATGLFLLKLDMQMPTVFSLRTVSDDEAIIEGSGRNMGTAIRVERSDGTETLRVFGVKFRKK